MCIVYIISVLLWTMTIINFYRALESLCIKDDFNFTNFLINIVMRCSMKVLVIATFAKWFDTVTFGYSQ